MQRATPVGAEEVGRVLERLRAALAGREAPDPGLQVALDRLFAVHADAVRATCRALVRDPALAEELAQEALLVAWQKLPEFRGDAAFGTWLYGIARNVCRNALRRRRDALTEDGVLDPDDPQATVLSRMQREERELLLRDAAAAVLSPEEQEAVHLRYVEQLPQEAITDLLGIVEASGARGVLQRCRRKLERELRRRLDALGHGSSFARGTHG